MDEQNEQRVERLEEQSGEFEAHRLEDGQVADQVVEPAADKSDEPGAEDDFEGHRLEVGQVTDKSVDKVED